MNSHFRIALFVSLAGAVGLHVRPCLGCVVDAVAGPRSSIHSTVAASPVPFGQASAGSLADVIRDLRDTSTVVAARSYTATGGDVPVAPGGGPVRAKTRPKLSSIVRTSRRAFGAATMSAGPALAAR